ncbi:uncharacterized protein BN762_02338 [Bacteroides sp. CAG:714]|jgi:hypothetical protein|nr:uncharacterized protein BN762_02338 [Bacteroides sp. CAG:714]
MVGVDFDFSDVDSFFEQGENEVKEVEEKVGKEAVEYAVQHGSYQNRTGTLRKSNKYSVSDEGLELKNDAKSPKGYNYASNVESKGYEVLSGAALFAEKRLKEEIE